MQGKTQLFPSEEHDFYRTRLTHSLEVAQIAKSIATRLNNTHPYFSKKPENAIDCDLIEFAGLAHDLGHPPFGHNGEYVLDELMMGSGGFEGNAQTLRILTRLEKKTTTEYPPEHAFKNGIEIRRGLNLTFRGLASILKYDDPIPETKRQREVKAEREHKPLSPCKGYYKIDEPIVKLIKQTIAPNKTGRFKTIECAIMDVADDIAYSTYDIEDSFAAAFLTPISILSVHDTVKSKIVQKIQGKIDHEFGDLSANERQFTLDMMNRGLESVFADVLQVPSEVFQKEWTPESLGAAIGGDVHVRSELMARSSYHRTQFTSDLIGRLITEVEVIERDYNPMFWQVRPTFKAFTVIETLKMISYTQLISSDKFLADRRRAKHIIERIFTALWESGSDLLTPDWRQVYEHYEDDDKQKKRAICDFISGMTNRYCLEFYQRLFGVQPPSIHKP